jgi:hypothetical protein
LVFKTRKKFKGPSLLPWEHPWKKCREMHKSGKATLDKENKHKQYEIQMYLNQDMTPRSKDTESSGHCNLHIWLQAKGGTQQYINALFAKPLALSLSLSLSLLFLNRCTLCFHK